MLSDGYKMKWHNVGNGKVQLRLPVGLLSDAVLCHAYVKQNDKQERRMLVKFKTHLQLIRQGRHSAAEERTREAVGFFLRVTPVAPCLPYSFSA